jgi:ABC-type sugar transport system substrate-binding protein
LKKLIALLLVLAMVFTFVACASDTATTEGTEQTTEGTEETTEDANTTEETTETTEETTDSDATTNSSELNELGIPATIELIDSDALQGKKIGCTIVYKGDEWCYQLSVALETLGKYYGADITVEDGDANDETQVKQIENMIANQVDMILVDPLTPEGSHEALMKAVEAGIPIINYDSYWAAAEEHAVTCISWDQVETGRIVGEYFVNYVKENNDGKATVVEVANMLSTHCQDRWVGLHEVFDEANANGCEIKVLGTQYDSQGNRELAYNAISAIAEPYDYIISDVDNGAMGAVAALQATGNTDVKVLSMGAYGEEPFGMLHDGDPNYLACLNVDAWVLGDTVIKSAIAYFEGEEVPNRMNIDLYMVDASNVEDFWTF